MTTKSQSPTATTRVWVAMWLLVFSACLPVFAANTLVPVPPLQARLTDLTGTIPADQQSALEQKLRAFEERKGTQIAVLMLPTTKPEEIEQYSLRVVEQWKLGRKKVDDGALLLIAKDDRALRIEVGYGLEGVLNDATAKRIISETITPHLQNEDYVGAVTAGVDQLIRVIDGEPLPEPVRGPAGVSENTIGEMIPVLFVAAMVVGGVLRSILGRFLGAVATGGLLGFAGWMLGGALFAAVIGGFIAFLITLIGINAGRLGGMGGGGRSSGGGFGGGFGGGGGGFGGGGASGRW